MSLTARQYLEKGGLSWWAAIGIVKVLGAESGLRTDAENPKEGAFGIAQWTDARKERLYKFAAEHKEPVTSLAAQCGFLLWELHNYERPTLEALQRTHTINEAISAFVVHFERPENSAEVIKRAGGTPVYAGTSGGSAPADAAGMVVNASGDPPERSQKIYHTGKGMSEQGNHFKGHVAAMKALRGLHAPIKIKT